MSGLHEHRRCTLILTDKMILQLVILGSLFSKGSADDPRSSNPPGGSDSLLQRIVTSGNESRSGAGGDDFKRNRIDRRASASSTSSSWISVGDVAYYDCTATHSTHDPCENVDGSILLPLPPDCKHYMLCDNHKVTSTFTCAEGQVFDHRVKTCVSEELADCPCATNRLSDNTVEAWQENGSTNNGFTYTPSRGSHRIKDSKTAKVNNIDIATKSGKQVKDSKSSKSSKSSKGSKMFKPSPSTSQPTDSSPVTPSPTSSPVVCPPAYDSSVPYVIGDLVSAQNPWDTDVYMSYKCHKDGEFDSCDTVPPTILQDSWMFVGVCHYMGSKLLTPDGCPPVHGISSIYNKGDLVSAKDPDNDDVYNAYECSPTEEYPSCIVGLSQGWTLHGVCNDGSPDAENTTTATIEQAKTPANTVTTIEPTKSPVTPSPTPDRVTTLIENATVVQAEEDPSPCLSTSQNTNFESGSFPSSWTTGGDGSWTIDQGDTYEGMYSIKNPDLSGSTSYPAISNATASTCAGFAGGKMQLGVKASVMPPTDVFTIYIDGQNTMQLIDVNEWQEVSIDIPPGSHVIDFSYTMNPFNVNPLPSLPPGVEGAVYIDDIELIEAVSLKRKFLQLDYQSIVRGRDANVGSINRFHVGLFCLSTFMLSIWQ